MKISVITATWNSGKTVRDTIRSFVSQDYPNTEYVIIDGASSDSTLDIVRSFSNRIDHIVSEKDKGIYDALNKGVQLATGDVIGFLHSDDIYANNSVLSSIANAFESSQVSAVFGDLDYVAKSDPLKVIRRWKSGQYARKKMRNGWMPPHPTFYMKRSCYEKFGGFNLNYRIAADYDSLLRYLWKYDISAEYIPEVLVKMRVGGESNRSIGNIARKTLEDRRAMIANGLPSARALIGKNLSKIPQFFNR